MSQQVEILPMRGHIPRLEAANGPLHEEEAILWEEETAEKRGRRMDLTRGRIRWLRGWMSRRSRTWPRDRRGKTGHGNTGRSGFLCKLSVSCLNYQCKRYLFCVSLWVSRWTSLPKRLPKTRTSLPPPHTQCFWGACFSAELLTTYL